MHTASANLLLASQTLSSRYFSEPMHNLIPAATATLFMSQFCEDRMVGKKVEWCLPNRTLFIHLITKIPFCWDCSLVNIYVVYINLHILCESGEVYPYHLQQKSLSQISQLCPFQVTYHLARRCVTAHQSMYIYLFINLSFHPGNMTNLCTAKKSAHREEFILRLFFRSIPVWGCIL